MASTKVEPSTKDRRIDVREAARAAAQYFQALFPGVSNSSLEEVELSDDENYWLITLGFEMLKPKPRLGPPLEQWLSPPITKYKVFKVDVHTGEVRAMKIRSLG